MNHSGDIIMGAQGVLVPPSPGIMNEVSNQEHAPPDSPSLPTRKANSKMQVALKDRTSAGITKAQPKIKTTMRKLFAVTAGSAAATREKALHKPFQFMDLPGGKVHHMAQPRLQKLTIDRDSQLGLSPDLRDS
jgi:hypothetical protein